MAATAQGAQVLSTETDFVSACRVHKLRKKLRYGKFLPQRRQARVKESRSTRSRRTAATPTDGRPDGLAILTITATCPDPRRQIEMSKLAQTGGTAKTATAAAFAVLLSRAGYGESLRR